MSKPQNIINDFVQLLKDDPDLKECCGERVYKGVRKDVIAFPYLVIEPVNISESDDTYPRQIVRMNVMVVGAFKIMNKETQIDELFDFENKVKKAIGSDRRLSETVTHIEINESVYTFELWPVRNFSMGVAINFEQDSRTRL